MTMLELTLAVLVFAGCGLPGHSCPNYDEALSKVQWDGSFFTFPISSERLKARLEEVNRKLPDGVSLHLPAFGSTCLGEGQHVVQISVGTEDALSFEDAMTEELKDREKPRTHVLVVQFPFLASTEGGPPGYTLQYITFHPDPAKHIEANLILPAPVYVPDLTVVKNDTGFITDVSLSHDDLFLTMTANTPSSSSCSFRDIEAYEQQLSLSVDGPNFEACEETPALDVDFCDVYERFRGTIGRAKSNVCVYWETEKLTGAQTGAVITNISAAMRDILLIDPSVDNLESTGGIRQSGTAESHVVFPCFE